MVAGEHNTKVEEAFEQKVRVERIFMHPEYSCQTFKNIRPGIDVLDDCKNDIGKNKKLLRLFLP